eukprot:1196574-Amphidinium_carterae.1
MGELFSATVTVTVTKKYSELIIFRYRYRSAKNAQNYWEKTEVQLPLPFPKKLAGKYFQFLIP